MKSKTIPKKDKGFTLIELMVAVFIFGLVLAALATIYGTSHRHLMQNFRENVVKNSLSLAFKTIQQELSTATRIDAPPNGGVGDILAFARNISRDLDAVTGGCYPIDANTPSPTPAYWGYVCLTPAGELYFHKGIAGGGTGGCPATGGTPWTSTSYGVVCGDASGTALLKNAVCTGGCFRRNSIEGESEQVRIRLTVDRPATATGREINVTLDTVAKINMSKP